MNRWRYRWWYRTLTSTYRNARGDTRRLWIETNALTPIPRGKSTLSRRTLYLTSVVSCWYRSPAVWNAKAKRDVTYTPSVYNILEKIGETRGNYAHRGAIIAPCFLSLLKSAGFLSRMDFRAFSKSRAIRRQTKKKSSFFSSNFII